jgi:hypothetical protein
VARRIFKEYGFTVSDGVRADLAKDNIIEFFKSR